MTAHIDIVRAHYAASAQGNIDEMMAHVSPQVRWTEMAGFPARASGLGRKRLWTTSLPFWAGIGLATASNCKASLTAATRSSGWEPTSALIAPRERKCRLEWPT